MDPIEPIASDSTSSLNVRQNNGNIISSVMQRCGMPVTAAHLATHVAEECDEVMTNVRPIVQDYLRAGTQNGFVRKVGRKYESAQMDPEPQVLAMAGGKRMTNRRTNRKAAKEQDAHNSDEDHQESQSSSPKPAGGRRTRRAASRSRSRAKTGRSRSRSTKRKAGGKAKSPAKK